MGTVPVITLFINTAGDKKAATQWDCPAEFPAPRHFVRVGYYK